MSLKGKVRLPPNLDEGLRRGEGGRVEIDPALVQPAREKFERVLKERGMGGLREEEAALKDTIEQLENEQEAILEKIHRMFGQQEGHTTESSKLPSSERQPWSELEYQEPVREQLKFAALYVEKKKLQEDSKLAPLWKHVSQKTGRGPGTIRRNLKANEWQGEKIYNIAEPGKTILILKEMLQKYDPEK